MAFGCVCVIGCSGTQPESLPARLLSGPGEQPDFTVRASDVRHPLLPDLTVAIADGLSPAEAAVLAVAGNQELQAARASRGIARAQIIEAGVVPNPQLALSIDVPVAGVTTGTSAGYGADLSFDLVPLVARGARLRSAENANEGVELDLAWQEWQVALSAKAAVYDLIALELVLELTREAETEMGADAGRLAQLLAKQLTTSVDAAAAKTALAETKTLRLELEHERADRRLTLLELLGMSPSDEVTVARTELPTLTAPPAEAVLSEGIEDRRLDLLALRRGYASQAESTRAATLSRFPALTISGHVARDTAGLFTAGAAVSVGLPMFDRNQGAIETSRATQRALRAEYLARRTRAVFEIATATSDITWLAARVAAARESEKILVGVLATEKAGLAAGLVDAHDYYTSWRAVLDKRVEVIRLRQQMARAILMLESASGLFDLSMAEPKEEAK